MSLNIEIGERLRRIRHLANEGGKLSAKQFAYLLDETADKILNYESGRAAISISLLIKLYRRGFNPIYLLTGEGSCFADNEQGLILQNKVDSRPNNPSVSDLKLDDDLTLEEMIHRAEQFSVAAGDILKAIKEKKGKV